MGSRLSTMLATSTYIMKKMPNSYKTVRMFQWISSTFEKYQLVTWGTDKCTQSGTVLQAYVLHIKQL